MNSNWNCRYVAMLQQSAQAKTRGPWRGCHLATGGVVARMSPTVGFRVDKGHWRDSELAAFVVDRERVNDTDDGLTVLAEWGTRNFFDMHRTAWAFTGIVTG